MLRASHIKPWTNCANSNERLDGYNALLLAPHIDLLFDRGCITFQDNDDLRLSKNLKGDRRAFCVPGRGSLITPKLEPDWM